MNTPQEIVNYTNKMSKIQEKILMYLETDEDNEAKDLFILLDDEKISESKYEFKELLYLISKIAKNHHRFHSFFEKIEEIIKKYQKEIKNYFTNFDIFNIFKGNKRILLFLFKEEILIPDESILSIITNDKYSKRCYPQYFSHEFDLDIDDPSLYEDDDELFEQKRKIGENDSYICTLIQNDSIDDFISYINKSNISLSSKIDNSIYETNRFLYGRNPTLIKYAAFFGSIQIFQYLLNNNIQLTPSIWLYAIHGQNPEIISILEDKKIQHRKNNENEKYKTFYPNRNLLYESIKCHHIDISNYIKENYYPNELTNDVSLRYHNYDDLINNLNDFNNNYQNLIKMIEYDYIHVVDYMLPNINFPINQCKSLKINHCVSYKNIFHHAVEKGRTMIVELLLKQPKLDVNCRYKNEDWTKSIYHATKIVEKSALFIAIENGFVDIFNLLISNPKINIKDEMIINDFEDVMTIKKPVLFTAVESGHKDIVEILLNRPDIDINEKSIGINESYSRLERTCLHIAVMNGKKEIISLLLSRKDIDINAKEINKMGSNQTEKTALHIAAMKGEKEIISLLLSRKDIDINAKEINKMESNLTEKTALHIAVENENVEAVELLLKRNDIKVNEKEIHVKNEYRSEKTALHLAIEKRNLDILKLLLSRRDIDINCYNIEKEAEKIMMKKTALYLAIISEDFDLFNTLLSNQKIDVNQSIIETLDTNDGNYHKREITALHLAVLKRTLFAVRILMRHKKVNSTIESVEYYESIDEGNICLISKKTAVEIANDIGDYEIISVFEKPKIEPTRPYAIDQQWRPAFIYPYE